jgi:hypothetical protein
MHQWVTKNRDKCGKPSISKCVILPSKMRQLALLSASNSLGDLTQIAVLFVSNSQVIQYELRSYQVQSLSGFTSDTLLPVPECIVSTYVFFYVKF